MAKPTVKIRAKDSDKVRVREKEAPVRGREARAAGKDASRPASPPRDSRSAKEGKDVSKDSQESRDLKDAARDAKEAAREARDAKPSKPPKEVFKCPFPADELGRWRQILLARRAEITDDIAGLVKDAMEAEDGHTTPNHIAERGSDADLQDMSLGVAGEEKDVVWQIDRALRKIDHSQPLPFGLCEYTKEPIPKTRLQLIPWTPLSYEGATHLEQNHLALEDLLLDE